MEGEVLITFDMLNDKNQSQDPIVPKDLRVINQPYVPHNAVLNIGITMMWLNAVVVHSHSIILIDNSTKNIV